jgi:hypothetical protein|tara:strand:- start:3161 stop:3769 length:609 start_codon:yes stop_codon:yes gene_type:complete
MDPFDVYKIYLAVKLHFTTESYDITKHKFATRGKRETFLKRKDLLVLRKMARDYDRKDIIDILVANFVSGKRWHGMFDSEAMETYNIWKANKQKLAYTFEQDLNTIQLRMEQDNIEDSTVASGHPLIFKLLLGKQIAIETVVILNKGLQFVNEYKDDLILKDTVLMVNKYTPFMGKNTNNLHLKHLGLINIIARTRNSSYTT